MKKRLQIILTLGLFLAYASLSVTPVWSHSKTPPKFQGFLGTYHPFKGTAYGGGENWKEGELLQTAFNFGANAIISHAAYNGYTFTENVQNNCHEWDINKLYGVLLPPTEKGAVNQPGDLDLMKPFQSAPGMIQGAHRFSEISKSCPQLSGVIIDDFFHDYPKLLTAENVRDIREALRGKTVDAHGKVDYSSPATTPNLKLYIVVYEHQLDRTAEKSVLEAVDGISFWIWGQNEKHKNFDAYIEKLRTDYPGKEIIAGFYVFSSKETATPTGVHYMIERAVDSYAQGKINGLLMFSAIWLSREKIQRERWNELALPQALNRLYYPFLGEGGGRVVDAKTKKPVENALVTVTRFADGGKPLLVARKFTDANGKYRFGGWAGKNKKDRVRYEIKIETSAFRPRVMNIKLRAGERLNFADARLKK